MKPQEDDIKKIVQIEVKKEVNKQLSFSVRKLADTPIDDLMVTPRRYVNMYGSIASRPQTSVIGQQYFDTTNGYPIFRNSNNAWVNSVGSVIG